MAQGHFLILSFPLQGHLNPALQLAKRLLRTGVDVTLATTISSHRQIHKTMVPTGLAFATFSDGYDDGVKDGDAATAESYIAEIERHGSQGLTRIIYDCSAEGRPVTCLIYTTLLNWAIRLARGLHVPSAFLWTQPATVLDIYYFSLHRYGDVIKNKWASGGTITLPGLPLLSGRDLPSLVDPHGKHAHLSASIQELFEAMLDQESKPKILVNTFEALEPEAIRVVDRVEMISIGPFITPVSEQKDDDSSPVEEWLSSQRESSVVYVSFGSIAVLSKQQMEEVAGALLESGRPFLWVIRGRDAAEELSCAAELGLIVRWCSQVAVLSHAAVGCFVTHFGWNSTLESLAAGMPTVGMPQWLDQATNAKLVEDVWGTGVRAAAAGDEGVVAREEIGRCVEMVMGRGKRGEEIRRNARKWKELTRDALREGGSSDKNLRRFVEEIGNVLGESCP